MHHRNAHVQHLSCCLVVVLLWCENTISLTEHRVERLSVCLPELSCHVEVHVWHTRRLQTEVRCVASVLGTVRSLSHGRFLPPSPTDQRLCAPVPCSPRDFHLALPAPCAARRRCMAHCVIWRVPSPDWTITCKWDKITRATGASHNYTDQ